MSFSFRGKTIIITGASAGVGRACARAFASEGAQLVLAARGEEALERIRQEVAKQTQTLAIPTDVADDGQCQNLVQRALDKFGNLHVLINNAGANSRGAFSAQNWQALAQVVDVNLRAPVVLSRLCLPHIRDAGGGAIVNVASLAGRIPLPHEAVYSATKFGLRALSLALAEELRDSPVRVGVVSPGPIDTSFLTEDLGTVPDIVLSQPMSTAEEVAELVVQCARGGPAERALPRASGYLTTLGYVVPPLARVLRPLMERRGRAAKRRYLKRQAN